MRPAGPLATTKIYTTRGSDSDTSISAWLAWMGLPTALGERTKTEWLLSRIVVVSYHSRLVVGFPSDGQGLREMPSLGSPAKRSARSLSCFWISDGDLETSEAGETKLTEARAQSSTLKHGTRPVVPPTNRNMSARRHPRQFGRAIFDPCLSDPPYRMSVFGVCAVRQSIGIWHK